MYYMELSTKHDISCTQDVNDLTGILDIYDEVYGLSILVSVTSLDIYDINFLLCLWF